MASWSTAGLSVGDALPADRSPCPCTPCKGSSAPPDSLDRTGASRFPGCSHWGSLHELLEEWNITVNVPHIPGTGPAWFPPKSSPTRKTTWLAQGDGFQAPAALGPSRYGGIQVSRYDQSTGTGLLGRFGPTLCNEDNRDFASDVNWGSDDFSVVGDGKARDSGTGVHPRASCKDEEGFEVSMSGGGLACFRSGEPRPGSLWDMQHRVRPAQRGIEQVVNAV